MLFLSVCGLLSPLFPAPPPPFVQNVKAAVPRMIIKRIVDPNKVYEEKVGGFGVGVGIAFKSMLILGNCPGLIPAVFLARVLEVIWPSHLPRAERK